MNPVLLVSVSALSSQLALGKLDERVTNDDGGNAAMLTMMINAFMPTVIQPVS